GEAGEREHERAPLPVAVGGAAADHQEPGEGDRVRVDDPLQVDRREAETRLDRRQRDVDDAQVEDDHELRHAAHGEQPAVPLAVRLLGSGGDAARRRHSAVSPTGSARDAFSTASDESTIRSANVAESFTRGNGTSGTGSSSSSQIGSQPSAGDHTTTSSKSSCTWAL